MTTPETFMQLTAGIAAWPHYRDAIVFATEKALADQREYFTLEGMKRDNADDWQGYANKLAAHFGFLGEIMAELGEADLSARCLHFQSELCDSVYEQEQAEKDAFPDKGFQPGDDGRGMPRWTDEDADDSGSIWPNEAATEDQE